MLFEISNIMANFQGYINKILVKKFNFFIIVYLNNIFIYNKYSIYAYTNDIYFILDILKIYKLFANLKNC